MGRLFQPVGSFVALASLGFALTACGASEGSRSNGDTRIVLDRSIGGVALREKRTDVERQLGHGFVVHTEDQKPPYPAHAEQVLYAKYGLEVYYVSRNATPLALARGRVLVVLTHSPRYRTPQGVHVGSPAAALHAIKGIKCSLEDCQHGYTALNHPGTSFRLDYEGGKVVTIAMAFGH